MFLVPVLHTLVVSMLSFDGVDALSSMITIKRMGEEMDLRKARRYFLVAPVLYTWENASGMLQAGDGTTRDISIGGAFIVAKSPPPLGVHVRLDVYLPSLGGLPKSLQLHGKGEVVRVITTGESGFAAEIVFQNDNFNDRLIQ
jgi:hypothetical protein